MSSLKFNPKTGKARIFIRYRGRQLNRTVKVKSERAGWAICEIADQTIADLECGRLTLPPEADLAAFLFSRGKVVEDLSKQATPKAKTLADLVELYQTDPPPHREASTRKMPEIHFRRLLEVFPAKLIAGFGNSTAQDYVSRRSKQSYRKRPIQPETIAKELQTLRQAWAWVALRSADIPPPMFALKELSFPKAKEKLPFMTWAQIEREIERGGLKEEEIAE